MNKNNNFVRRFSITSFVFLYKELKIVYTTEKVPTELNYLSSFNTHGTFISYNVDKIAFIFNTSSDFLFQACIIYCFHA